MTKKLVHQKNAFTLIELLAGVTIFSALLGIALTSVTAIQHTLQKRDEKILVTQGGSYAYEPIVEAVKAANGKEEFWNTTTGQCQTFQGFYILDSANHLQTTPNDPAEPGMLKFDLNNHRLVTVSTEKVQDPAAGKGPSYKWLKREYQFTQNEKSESDNTSYRTMTERTYEATSQYQWPTPLKCDPAIPHWQTIESSTKKLTSPNVDVVAFSLRLSSPPPATIIPTPSSAPRPSPSPLGPRACGPTQVFGQTHCCPQGIAHIGVQPPGGFPGDPCCPPGYILVNFLYGSPPTQFSRYRCDPSTGAFMSKPNNNAPSQSLASAIQLKKNIFIPVVQHIANTFRKTLNSLIAQPVLAQTANEKSLIARLPAVPDLTGYLSGFPSFTKANSPGFTFYWPTTIAEPGDIVTLRGVDLPTQGYIWWGIPYPTIGNDAPSALPALGCLWTNITKRTSSEWTVVVPATDCDPYRYDYYQTPCDKFVNGWRACDLGGYWYELGNRLIRPNGAILNVWIVAGPYSGNTNLWSVVGGARQCTDTTYTNCRSRATYDPAYPYSPNDGVNLHANYWPQDPVPPPPSPPPSPSPQPLVTPTPSSPTNPNTAPFLTVQMKLKNQKAGSDTYTLRTTVTLPFSYSTRRD